MVCFCLQSSLAFLLIFEGVQFEKHDSATALLVVAGSITVYQMPRLWTDG